MVVSSYEKFFQVIFFSDGFMTRFVAGAAAGATAQFVAYPLELMMARNASHWNVEPRYKTYSGALKEIMRTEGVLGLYRGLSPAMIGILPYAGLNFAIYETLKENYALLLKPKHEELALVERLACGGVAGLVAQTATYPIHIIKRRMQVFASCF